MTDTKNIVTAIKLNGSHLDSKHVVLLKKMPMTMWKNGPHTAKGMPYLNSIVTTGNRDKQVDYVVVAYGVENRFHPNKTITPMFSVLGKPVNHRTHDALNKFFKDHKVAYPLASKHKHTNHQKGSARKFKKSRHANLHGYSHSDKIADEKKFKKMKYVEVVAGYHVGMAKPNDKFKYKHPYIDTNKCYNFKVDSGTRFLSRDKDHTLAIVLTAKGVSQIVIDHEQHASGSKSIPIAKTLKPVISFTGKEPENNWVRKMYKRFLSQNK